MCVHAYQQRVAINPAPNPPAHPRIGNPSRPEPAPEKRQDTKNQQPPPQLPLATTRHAAAHPNQTAEKRAAMSDDGERHAAMVEFVGIFETVQSPPAALADLSDGVALFEALSEM